MKYNRTYVAKIDNPIEITLLRVKKDFQDDDIFKCVPYKGVRKEVCLGRYVFILPIFRYNVLYEYTSLQA